MAANERVTTEDVRQVAELANLQLTTDEEVRMQKDLSAIIDYIGELNELNTDDVVPMAQVAEVLGHQAVDGAALREDRVVPSLDRASVMISAPESDGIFFKVPKVIER